ncbi:MAG: M20 family metallopeptidase [Bacteroidota bacterium]
MKEKIIELSNDLFNELVEVRRHLHAHPELSFQEKETSAFIAKKLSEAGISHRTNIGGYGILAEIHGELDGEGVIALRADMDALPIEETTAFAFASQNKGVMHACGHDVHSTCVLGAALILNQMKPQFGGTIQFIFQPAEEVLPGGAKLMLEDGVFDQGAPQHILGQHVFPELPVGKVGFRAGPYMASTDEIYIRVIGKGGHGAKPDQVIDPVLISAHLLIALQQVASRWSNPQMPTVLSFGKIEGKGATNIIPNEVHLAGTFRTFSEQWRMEAHEKIKNLCEHVVSGMGGHVEIRIEKGYPVLVNDEAYTAYCREMAENLFGTENVVELEMRTTAEDFAYFAQAYPSCFYRLGTSNPDGTFSLPVHNSGFSVNEESIKIGSQLMSWLAIQSLKL